jgi:hypothetical protein
VAGEERDGALGGDEDCYSGEDLGGLVRLAKSKCKEWLVQGQCV